MSQDFFNRNGPYNLLIAQGKIPGAEAISGFGLSVTGGAVTNQIIWPGTTFHIPPMAGTQMNLVSTSADDNPAGTGIRLVEIHYLDGNLDPQVEQLATNGLTPVPTVATDIRFVQCLHGYFTGTGLAAAGTISLSFGGLTYAIIRPGRIRCESSARMVPRGKQLIVSDLAAGASSGTAAANVLVEYVATQIDVNIKTYENLFFPHGIAALQDNTSTMSLTSPGPFQPGVVVAMRATTDKAASVTASWFGWIENLQ
jgi:hypothetical protein